MARRALLRYFLREIESACKGQSSIFVPVLDNLLENVAHSSSSNVDFIENHTDYPNIVESSKKHINFFENITDLSKKSSPLLKLRSGVTFHFFCSHTPCGDASIFLKDDCVNNDKQARKRLTTEDKAIEPCIKKYKTEDDYDVYRTGAKCLSKETRQDPHLPGTAYHVVGAVRTKPGRGDQTLSVSCSDKLFRWYSCGIQVINRLTKKKKNVLFKIYIF